MGWFEVIAVPKPMLLLFLLGAILVDFITGIVKSWSKGKPTTPVGFRKTVTKLGTYVGSILGVWILVNILNTAYTTSFDYTVIINGSIGFLTFIEVYSVFENIYEIDPNSLLSRKFIKPILKFLKGKLDSSHPLDDLTNKNKKDETN